MRPMSRPDGEIVEVVIEKLVTGGLGLARHDGLTVLVPLAAPGDRLAVRLVERRAGWARGELLEVLAAGPARRDAPCPHYARCGGCDLQHLQDGAQLALKAQAAVETLARLGGVRLERPPTLVAGAPWGYRRRAQLRVVAPRDGDGAPHLGQLARGSHELVALERCPILVPALEARFRDLPAMLARRRGGRLELAAGDAGAWTGRLDGEPLEGAALESGAVAVRVGPLEYRFNARCFFQGHAQMLGPLVEAALGPTLETEHGAAAGEAADLYAGVGLFTLPLAARHRRVHAVESEPAAAEYLAGNAERNGVDNVTLHAVPAEQAAGRLPRGLDRVLVDPPRAGLSPPVRRALLALAPRRLTYVSCDVATLARDLRALAAGFELEGVTLLDMFPQTSHIEAVVQLHRRAAAIGRL